MKLNSLGSLVVNVHSRRKMKIVLFGLALSAVAGSSSHATMATLPPDFTGSYQILQSRTLSLTANGRGYVLQDGALLGESSVDRNRAYCRAGQSKFDEPNGIFQVTFGIAVDGFQHALLKTVPAVAGHQPTTIECIAETGFSGPLDISIALGRIVELTK